MENLLEYLSRSTIINKNKESIESENASYKSFKYCLVTEVIGGSFSLREFYVTLFIAAGVSKSVLYDYKDCNVYYDGKKCNFISIIDPLIKEHTDKVISISIKNGSIESFGTVDFKYYKHISEYMYTILGGKNVKFYDSINKNTIEEYCKKFMWK